MHGPLFGPDGKTLIAAGEGAQHGLFLWDWQAGRHQRGGFPKLGLVGLSADIDETGGKTWSVGKLGGCWVADDGTLLLVGPKGLQTWKLPPAKAAD